MLLDPFAPIEKKELYTQDGMQSLGYSVRVEKGINEDTLRPEYLECGVVSNNYLLIPNEDVVNIAKQVAGSMDSDVYSWKEQKCLFNGRRFTYSMVLETEDTNYKREVKLGEPVSLGMIWQNTYDGSSSLNYMFFVNVLSCLNGQLSPRYFNRYRFKHDNTSSNWEEQVTDAMTYLQYAPKQLDDFVHTAQNMTEDILSKEDLKDIRTDSIPAIGSNAWGNIMDKYLTAGDYTKWGLMQSCTNEFWHKKNLTQNHIKNNEYCVTKLMAEA